ncbi:Phosphoribosylformylglycinamidine synthase subunit PurL [uncultured archaeon]|nr:Phosphoribosylformylglycinamidine synthase subunit PurL [uncultured archaeon]
MEIRSEKNTIAKLPSSVVANAPLIDRPVKIPKYLKNIKLVSKPKMPEDLSSILLKMLSNPNIASKQWVYTQYDHEVGIRTVIKPGSDASVLRLDNGKFISIKIDGNSKHCYVNPRQGVMGCFDEACRNVVCTGATPIGVVDHLQFGNPEDPEIFWTFKESIEGITDYSKYFEIPCVGGKVSLYNETDNGPIKPTPLIGVLGLIDSVPLVPKKVEDSDLLVLIGSTKDELGGSEYYEYIHGIVGGNCPSVDLAVSKANQQVILDLINNNVVKTVHDCSKGGFAITVSELCIANEIGCIAYLDKIPSENLRLDELLFSESHSRFMLVISKKDHNYVKKILEKREIIHSFLGEFTGQNIVFKDRAKIVTSIRVDKAQEKWLNSLGTLVSHG